MGGRLPLAQLRKKAAAEKPKLQNEEVDETSVKEENDIKESNEEAPVVKRKRKRKPASADVVVEEEEDKSSQPSATTPQSDLANEKNIYIEGLPFAATEDDVRNFFSSVGDINNIRLPRWHDSGRLRGYGHVEFSSAGTATKALQLNGKYMLDRYIKVQRPMVPRASAAIGTTGEAASASTVVRPAGCKTVFIKNLPYVVTVEAISEVMQVCGPVANIRLAMWGHTNQQKGFGYVDFKREESAEIAVKKSGKLTINGRAIICDFETGNAKGSFKGTELAPKKKQAKGPMGGYKSSAGGR